MISSPPTRSRKNSAISESSSTPAAYGAGNVASGQASLDGVGSLIAGVAIGAGAVPPGMRYHRRRSARRAAHASPGSSADGMRTVAAPDEDR